VSKACTSLCMWVHAMYKYYFVNKSVAPKKATLATAKEELAITEKALAEAKARMKELTNLQKGIGLNDSKYIQVMDGLAVLEKKLQDTMNHKAKLEANMKLCEDRMGRAVRLVSGLADEKERWKSTVASLGLTISNVIGDVLISAGCHGSSADSAVGICGACPPDLTPCIIVAAVLPVPLVQCLVTRTGSDVCVTLLVSLFGNQQLCHDILV
ncbi:unnamed protein product, partial [Timema podura]|nr:unnamed protein product [Timema podura]